MKKLKSFFKILYINFLLLTVGLISVEIFLRILINAKIDFYNPRSSAWSLLRAIQNYPNWGPRDQGNILRKPYPYQMFKGSPNKLDHNNLGFRISDPIKKSTINIALFGGSTGYSGDPPIINIITNELNKQTSGIKYSSINFSVVSSNHNQHLHSLVENSDNYPIDLIIFYGGYNETLQTAFNDPRPGYPYNFKKRNELSPEKMLLAKHFVLYQLFEELFPSNYKRKVWSKEWSEEIINNYSLTIEKARQISKVFSTGRCSFPFVFVYQPINFNSIEKLDRNFLKRVHIPISELTKNSIDGIDLSKIFKNYESIYTDSVHVTQKGKEIISKNILNSKIFNKAISSCSLNSN